MSDHDELRREGDPDDPDDLADAAGSEATGRQGADGPPGSEAAGRQGADGPPGSEATGRQGADGPPGHEGEGRAPAGDADAADSGDASDDAAPGEPERPAPGGGPPAESGADGVAEGDLVHAGVGGGGVPLDLEFELPLDDDPDGDGSLLPEGFFDLAPEVDRLYLEFRKASRDPEGEFEAFSAAHPEHADRHLFLHQQWRELGGILGKLGGDDLANQIRAFAEYSQTLSSFGEDIRFDEAAVARLRQEGFARRYRVVREIHRSRLSVLREVFDRRLQRACAMKVLLLGDDLSGDAQQFVLLAEALITAQLEHPAIVPIQDVGFDDEGRLCFVMKLVRGRTFEHVISAVAARREGWTLHKALRTLLRICDALEYAHSHGVSHQDIKPANIMVGRWGEAYLMDWGLHTRHGEADELLGDDGGDVRIAGAAMGIGPRGTPLYMSPEQARLQHDLTGPASDVYSMGSVLYHLIAGRPAYLEPGETPTLWEIVRQVACHPPRPLAEVAPSAQPELVAICDRAMQREIPDRYASTTELREALAQFLEDEAEERQEALRQARRARASNDMLMDILAFGQVDIAGSRDFTVRQAMDAAARRLRESPPPVPTDRADLALVLGNLYAHCGQVDAALEFLTVAHELSLDQYGPRHANTLEAAAALAWARYMRGEVETACEELAAIHAVQAEELGELAPDSLHTLWRLAQALQKSGAELAVVQAHYRQVRDGYTEIDGPDSLGALNAISGWARVLSDRGRPDEAISHLERAVEGMLRVFGENHSSTLIQQNDLAKACLAAGQLDRAEALFRHVLARQGALLEEGHIHTETTRNNLGMVLLERGDAEALPVLESALRGKARHLGRRHPDVLVLVHNLGVAHLRMGELARAERLLRHCVWVQDRIGERTLLSGRALYNQGRALSRLGRRAEAREHLQRSAEVLGGLMAGESQWLRDVRGALAALGSGAPPGASDAPGSEGGATT